MQAACADNSVVKWVHIQISNQYGSGMPCFLLGQSDLLRKLVAFLSLTLSLQIKLAGKVGGYNQNLI